MFLHIFDEDSEAFPSSTTKQRNILVLMEFYWIRTSGVSNEKWVIRATAQKNKFFIEDLFSKCVQIRRKLRIWSHLLKKSSMKNFIFVQCALLSRFFKFIMVHLSNKKDLLADVKWKMPGALENSISSEIFLFYFTAFSLSLGPLLLSHNKGFLENSF